MKITVLTENTACRDGLICEHGLSLFIETDSTRILFDTGQTDAFAKNAERLGIDLAGAELAVLSHGHYDHGGGLTHFLEINPSAPVYFHREAFGSHWHGPDKYIGLSPALSGHPRLIPVDRVLRLCPTVTLHPGHALPCPHGIRSQGLSLKRNGILTPDTFLHEQYLLMEEKGKRILFSGCSHRGIQNIAEHFRPDVLIGGFHFSRLDPLADSGFLCRAAEDLLALPAVYYTGHCTGQSQFAFLKERMGPRLHSLSTGSVIEI